MKRRQSTMMIAAISIIAAMVTGCGAQGNAQLGNQQAPYGTSSQNFGANAGANKNNNGNEAQQYGTGRDAYLDSLGEKVDPAMGVDKQINPDDFKASDKVTAACYSDGMLQVGDVVFSYGDLLGDVLDKFESSKLNATPTDSFNRDKLIPSGKTTFEVTLAAYGQDVVLLRAWNITDKTVSASQCPIVGIEIKMPSITFLYGGISSNPNAPIHDYNTLVGTLQNDNQIYFQEKSNDQTANYIEVTIQPRNYSLDKLIPSTGQQISVVLWYIIKVDANTAKISSVSTMDLGGASASKAP